MFHVPRYYHDVSLALSRVLEDIGLNERMVTRRRRTALLTEAVYTVTSKLNDKHISLHQFGSQVEGTTTLGLDSDTDMLFCDHRMNVIEDWMDWKAGVINMLMYRDANTPPGYCMLQQVYGDVPLPLTEPWSNDQVKIKEGLVVLKNTLYNDGMAKCSHRDGAAYSYQEDGYVANDLVVAFPCCSLPSPLLRWIDRQMSRGNITQEMKQYIENNNCYVVPVGHKASDFEEMEFRISTSHAEKCVMWNLNVTQLQCYVLMKMFLKSHLHIPGEKALSSYMCKNVLLRCIEMTPSRFWKPSNLLTMLTLCLSQLKICISQNVCPHFVIHDNNLMAGKIASSFVRTRLLANISDTIKSLIPVCLNMEMDDIGKRLRLTLNIDHVMMHNISSAESVSQRISVTLINGVASIVSACHQTILMNSPYNCLSVLVQLYYRGSSFDSLACILLKPLIYSNIACTLASSSIQHNDTVSDMAVALLDASLNSDVASSRLKLASVYYCVGDFVNAEIVLRGIDEMYDLNTVAARCRCYDIPGGIRCSSRFLEYADSHNELSLVNVIAFCVRFTRSEIGCVPRELQYEMNRSTPEELQLRDKGDCWMDLAVVDSLPFLYFLQYKVYGHLHQYLAQHTALYKLMTIVQQTYRNFGHRDTAWNLLGQCMEQENRHNDALACYAASLNIRPNNNAARIHVWRLLHRSIYG